MRYDQLRGWKQAIPLRPMGMIRKIFQEKTSIEWQLAKKEWQEEN